MAYTINNDWFQHGTDLEEFKSVLDGLSEITEEVLVETERMNLLSYVGPSEYGPERKPVYRMRPLDRELIEKAEKTGEIPAHSRCNTKAFAVREDNEDIFKEENDECHVHLLMDGPETSHYFFSKVAFMQLLDKVKLGGGAMQNPSLCRDIEIAKALNDLSKGKARLKLITRTVTAEDRDAGHVEVKKVFAVVTPRYTRIDLHVLPKVIEQLISSCSLGEAEVSSWTVTQDFSEIRVEFPEKADDFTSAYGLPQKVVPGIRLCSSDTGTSSVIIEPTYRIGNGLAIGEEKVKQVHSGDVTEESILSDVQSQVLTKLQSFPSDLAERLGVQIGSEDLSTKTGRRENKRLIMRCIRAGMNELKINKILGRNGKKTVLEKVRSEIDDSLRYTEFDIAVILMGLADRISTASGQTKIALAKACGRAASVSYMDLVNKGEDEDDIFISDPEDDEI